MATEIYNKAAPDLLAVVAVWVRVAAAVSLGGSIFCGTLCAGIGPGFVMVVIVVGIIRVDMVSIFATWSLSRRDEGRGFPTASRDRGGEVGRAARPRDAETAPGVDPRDRRSVAVSPVRDP